MEQGSGAERREFLRYSFDKPISYKTIAASATPGPVARVFDAVARNLSASGVLFATNAVPQLSSIVMLEMDYRTTRICQEIEENALIVKNRVVGKVVRIEEGDEGTCLVGVAFIKRLSDLPKNVEQLIV